MVNQKGKAIVSSSNPMEINGQETVVACPSNGAEDTASKEATKGENKIVEMKNGKIAMGGEKNEETSRGKQENNEGSKMEDCKKNESNAEEDNDQNATAEEDDGDEEAEEEDDEKLKEMGEEKEENAVEKKEEKVGANSNDKVKKSRKRRRKKNMKDDGEKGVGNEENTKQENDKVVATSGEKVKRPRKRTKRNKMAGKGSETPETKKVDDKLGSSGNKKASEKAESMGMIFMCSSKTKKDCYHYNVLGLPASKKDMVQKIYKGMRLFLFDFDLKQMYGIYKAAGPGGYNIEPEAFKSAFPSQVRFTVLEDCSPLAEEEFKSVIKENYYGKNKFDCQLNSTQVKDLCKLFAASSRDSNSKKLGRNGRKETRIGKSATRNLKGEARTRLDRGRIRLQGRDKVKRSSAFVAGRRQHDSRPTAYPREAYRQRSPLVGSHRPHDRPIVYERELAPLHHLPPLPPRTAPPPLYSGALSYSGAPSYASYGKSLEIDAYGRERRLVDLDSRVDDSGIRDPYISYRDVPSYRDTLYSSAVPAQPEYYAPVEPRAEYRLAAPPLPEYRLPAAAAAAPSDYDRLRPLYRY